MGVSIHYRGRLAAIQNIKRICDELAAIADRMNWPCTRLDEDWSQAADATIEVTEQGSQITGHLSLKGIALTPHPQCETVQFFFDANGHLRDPISLVEFIISPFWDFFLSLLLCSSTNCHCKCNQPWGGFLQRPVKAPICPVFYESDCRDHRDLRKSWLLRGIR